MQCWIKLNLHLLLKLLIFLPSQIFGSHWMMWKCGLVAKTAVWSLWSAGFIFRIKGSSIKILSFMLNLSFPNVGRRIQSSLGERQKTWLPSQMNWDLNPSSASPCFMTFNKLLSFFESWFPSYTMGIIINTCLLCYFTHSIDIYWVPMYQSLSYIWVHKGEWNSSPSSWSFIIVMRNK